jgi:hypothetical protein
MILLIIYFHYAQDLSGNQGIIGQGPFLDEPAGSRRGDIEGRPVAKDLRNPVAFVDRISHIHEPQAEKDWLGPDLRQSNFHAHENILRARPQ